MKKTNPTCPSSRLLDLRPPRPHHMQCETAPPRQVDPSQLCSPESRGRASVGETQLAQLACSVVVRLQQLVCARLKQGGQVLWQWGVGWLGERQVAGEAPTLLCLPLVLQQVLEVRTGHLVKLLILLSAAPLLAPGCPVAIRAVDKACLVAFEANSAKTSVSDKVRLVLGERSA